MTSFLASLSSVSFVLLFLGVTFGGCRGCKSKPTTPPPQPHIPDIQRIPDPDAFALSRADAESAERFFLCIGAGSPLDGFSVVELTEDGLRTFTHRVSEQNRRFWKEDVSFLSPEACLSVLRQLADMGVGRLPREIRDRTLADGTQLFLRLDIGEQRKLIYCDNYWPPELEALYEDLSRRFLLHNKAILLESRMLDGPPRKERPLFFDLFR